MLTWSSLDVRCPQCTQPIGARCRTLATQRVTDTHMARRDAAYEAARAR